MTWENLVRDPQVELGVLEQNKQFRQFVEVELPAILKQVQEETLNLKRIMKAQHMAVLALAQRSVMYHKRLSKIARGLSQHEHADVFLYTLGITEEAYVQGQPGLTDAELVKYKLGALTVGDLLKHRPAVILAPVLRPKHLI